MTQATLRHRRSPLRRVLASLRDTWVLVREFREALLIFLVTLLGGALSFQALWNGTFPEPIRYVDALYNVLSMTFFNAAIDFPREWYLDIYFFLMPIIGLAVLARGAADFVTLLFNRSLRRTQWEEAVASTFNDHVIVCGLGHLGLRVVRELVKLDESIVVIERNAESPRFEEVRGYDIPILTGDARQPDILKKAGIAKARAVIVCTNDDLVNLQMASRIREADQSVRIVMRMFDDEFARNMAQSFNISSVMSASMLAAPAFAGAASGAEIIQTFGVADRVLVMGRIRVQAASRLHGCPIEDVERALDLSVVLLESDDKVDVHPNPETVLKVDDRVAVVAEPVMLKKLISEWNKRRG
jgi:voltage-gated potassium channel